jgi:hypothetical protein
MQLDTPNKSQPEALAADPFNCPMCRGRLIRARRRVVDRLRSLFSPVKRYRCANFACQWHGNIAERRTEQWEDSISDAPPQGDRKRPKGSVPAAFVVHMVLVVVGVVFVLVFSSLEPVPWITQPEPARDAFIYEPLSAR